MTGPVKRPYSSERRREQAEHTRQRVFDAAESLFVQVGFERASVNAIAEAAAVSPETIYARFGNKRTLLGELVRRAVRGDDAAPVLEQSGPRAVAASRDQHEQIRLFAGDISARLARAAPLIAVVAGAAAGEPDLAELLATLHGDRRRNLRMFVGALAANGPLGLRPEQALDSVWAFTSPELYRLLTHVRGWSRRRYADWLAATLAATLLPRGGPDWL